VLPSLFLSEVHIREILLFNSDVHTDQDGEVEHNLRHLVHPTENWFLPDLSLFAAPPVCGYYPRGLWFEHEWYRLIMGSVLFLVRYFII
jgi:hypothetical protein